MRVSEWNITERKHKAWGFQQEETSKLTGFLLKNQESRAG